MHGFSYQNQSDGSRVCREEPQTNFCPGTVVDKSKFASALGLSILIHQKSQLNLPCRIVLQIKETKQQVPMIPSAFKGVDLKMPLESIKKQFLAWNISQYILEDMGLKSVK